MFIPLSHSSALFSSGLFDNIIQDIICTYLVLPNRISIPLVGESRLAQLRFPIPKVRVERLLSAGLLSDVDPQTS